MEYRGQRMLDGIKKDMLEVNLRKKYGKLLLFQSEVYLFGTGMLGDYVREQMERNNIAICGFVDNDKQKQGGILSGYPIYSLSKIPKNSIIIIATIVYWHTIRLQLEECGYTDFICYEELALCDERFPVYNQSFDGLFKQLYQNKNEYIELYNSFEDEKSVEILDNLIMFRLTLDTQYTEKAYQLSIADGPQYFDRNIMLPEEEEVFVDGGGYTGDSAEMFINWTGNKYKKIFFYELDDKVMEMAKDNLKGFADIEYIQAGLGSCRESVFYSGMNAIGGGMISENGDIPVELNALDERKERVSFIKMDIEGSEKEALTGAKETIMLWKPKLAISVYHKPEDLFELLNFIKEIDPAYKFYLRHYTNVYADTVLYGIRESGE